MIFQIQGASTASWTICTSRNGLKIDGTLSSASCATVSSGSHRVTIACDDAKYIHECNPLYMSVSVNATGEVVSQCTDRYCRYPDMMKFTISYENLVCTSAASSIVLSPIILLLMIVYSYLL